MIRRFRGHDSTVNTVKFNRDNTIVVTGGYDKCVKVWDCRSQAMDAIQVGKGSRRCGEGEGGEYELIVVFVLRASFTLACLARSSRTFAIA